MTKFWFYISTGYRNYPSIETFNRPYNKTESNNYDYNDENSIYPTPYDAIEFDFEIPEKDYFRLYIVNNKDYDNENECKHGPIWYKDILENEYNTSVYPKIHCQIHNCLPLVIVGYNSAYKEIGEWPEVSKDIKDTDDIINETLIKKLSTNSDFYFFFVINSNGDEIFTKLLTVKS